MKHTLKTIVHGPAKSNCYVLSKDGRTLVIDAGAPRAMIEGEVDALLLTHGHFDHTDYAHEFSCDIYMNEADVDVYAFTKNAFDLSHSPSDNEVIELAGFKIIAMHVPGHTPGGICYYFPKEKLLFTGDTLFAGTIGRTDFPGGNSSALIKELKIIIGTLPNKVEVYPGHGVPTTIGRELEKNRFFKST